MTPHHNDNNIKAYYTSPTALSKPEASDNLTYFLFELAFRNLPKYPCR